jgi:hypothetical protein
VATTAPAAIAHAPLVPPVPQHTPSRSDDALNDRLRSLIPHGPVDFTPKRVSAGANEVTDQVQAAYEAALAPPPEILAKTFGIISHKRTVGEPDSIAYVFEQYKIGPFTACKAYKIVEHPFAPSSAWTPTPVGAGVKADFPAPSRGTPPDVGIVTIVPCNPSSYTHVEPGSITTPLPRHPDLATPPANSQ